MEKGRRASVVILLCSDYFQAINFLTGGNGHYCPWLLENRFYSLFCNYTHYAQNALQQEWGNFPFANWNGICWGLPLQLVQLIKIHFLPHLESFMWERKFEKKFFKKSHIQTPNGLLLIFKLPFPNGSYCNGVCRALWAWSLFAYEFGNNFTPNTLWCTQVVFLFVIEH